MADLKINWPEPPAHGMPRERDIHVWASSLALTEKSLAAYSSTLSTDETERARRFHFDRHRNRFVAGRGWLRAILGNYLHREPARLQFHYNTRGKPALKDPPQALHFNLAHSDDLALLAVTGTCPVGIDVERVRPLNDADAIASRFFSQTE